MSSSATLLVVTGAVLAVACGAGPLNPDRCNIRLAAISPDPATLTLGQVVSLQAQLTEASTCLPPDAQAVKLRWRSDNPDVASIDPVTGRVTAVGAGSAWITLFTVDTHTLLTQSSVVVEES
jgi:hypothetical protein